MVVAEQGELSYSVIAASVDMAEMEDAQRPSTTETAANHRTGPLTVKRRASCTQHASTSLRPTSPLIAPESPFYPSVCFPRQDAQPFCYRNCVPVF